jgi:hypothetical protein
MTHGLSILRHHVRAHWVTSVENQYLPFDNHLGRLREICRGDSVFATGTTLAGQLICTVLQASALAGSCDG